MISFAEEMSQQALEALKGACDRNDPVSRLEPLGVCNKTINFLEEDRGIIFIRDLLQCSRDDLLTIRNLGELSVKRIMRALAQYHTLPDEDDDEDEELKERAFKCRNYGDHPELVKATCAYMINDLKDWEEDDPDERLSI
ncbi:MAG: DNA-directed RNA polymerase subunit alpha C-terminal domain-containing protein [Candidatus Thorarchaeota archaeon]|jgi:DNA-directed RNA polymerase alpha subunit